MESLFSENWLLIVFYFFILILNIVVFIFSILLIIINNKDRKNTNDQSYELGISYQICICCIIHSISFFILFPFNKEHYVLSTIQAFLNITSLLECINIIAAKIYFCYLYLKDIQKNKKNVLLGQICLSWIFPIVYGILCVGFGKIEVNYAKFFSWVSNKLFDYFFTGLFGVAFIIAFIFNFKINSGMNEIIRGTSFESSNSNHYQSFRQKIRINYIIIFFSLIVFSFDIIKQFIFGEISVLNYLDCIFDNIFIVAFCFYFGYEESKRKAFMLLFCCKEEENIIEEIIPDASLSIQD